MNKKTLSAADELALSALDTLLLKRGVRWPAFAATVDLDSSGLRTGVRHGTLSQLSRDKVEAYFGYESCIWSDLSTLMFRRKVKGQCGYDPHLLSLGELNILSLRLGVPWPNHVGAPRRRADRLAAVMAFFAANPNFVLTPAIIL